MTVKNAKPVASVTELWTYPVKSFAGITLQSARVGWHGLHGDRRYGFVRTGDTSGHPWLTARQLPALVTFQASFADPDDIQRSTVVVRAPDGAEADIDSEELRSRIEELYGKSVHLLHLYGGAFDANDLSLITVQSMDTVSAKADTDREVRRYRPNIVVEAFGEHPLPETRWVGKLLVFGDRPDSARIRVYRKDQRCNIVDVDPDSGERSGNLLRVIAGEYRNLLGVYGGAQRPGTIRVGDVVYLTK